MMKLLVVILNMLLFVPVAEAAWTPIVGIPEPGFGIDETVPALPDPWTSNTAGFYFVETGGTNSGNGYPGNPKGSIPALSAGDVVVIDGEYTGYPTINSAGTAGSPIFIIPYDTETYITDKWTFGANSEYVIVDGLNTNFGLTVSGAAAKIEIGAGAHHLAFRNMSIIGHGSYDGTSSLVAENQSVFVIYNPAAYGETHDIVIYNNDMERAGNWMYTSGDPDGHFVSMGVYAEDIWIIGNTFSYTSGCAVQVGAGTNGTNLDSTNARNIYIGGNTASNTCQSPFWAKQSNNVVMSENIVHDIRRNCPSSPNSTGFGGQYGPKNLWILNNTVYNTQSAVAIGANSLGVGDITAGPVYIMGNLFYDIHDEDGSVGNTWRTDASQGGGTVVLVRGSTGVFAINNTIDDYDAGILVASDITLTAYGNILSSHNTGVSYADINAPLNSGGSNALDYNNVEGTIWVKSEGVTYTDIATVPGTGNISASPSYVDESARNYNITASSADNGSSAAYSLYSTFQTNYGLSIANDIEGTTRPQNTLWDIGAYEYNEAVAPHSRGTVLLGQ